MKKKKTLKQMFWDESTNYDLSSDGNSYEADKIAATYKTEIT